MRPLVASLALLVVACATPKDVTQLEAELASAQDVIADLTARLDAMEARQRLVEAELVPSGDVPADAGALEEALAESRVDALEARATRADDAVATLTDDISERARIIATRTQIHVPSEQPTIQSALDSLSKTILMADVTIEVEEAGCDTNMPGAIYVDHPNGEHIRITTGRDELCVLNFPGGTGLSIREGTSLGTVTGFEFRGPVEGYGAGIEMQDQSTLLHADRLAISSFSVGIMVKNSGYINGNTIEITNCGNGVLVAENGRATLYNTSNLNSIGQGFSVQDGGTLIVDSSWSAGAYSGYQAHTGGLLIARDSSTCENHDCENPGVARGSDFSGYYAGEGATIVAPNSQSYGSGGSGYHATAGSIIIATHGTSTGNDQSGFECSQGSTIMARYSEATGNTRSGYDIQAGCYLEASLATASENTLGFEIAQGSHASLSSAVAQGNTETGAKISSASSADLWYLSASSNERYGVEVSGGSYADAVTTTGTNNGTALFNHPPHTASPDLSYINR